MISIFIPTKNAGNQFKEVLKSINNQKIKPCEIVIIDSGSKDNTLNIIKSYKKDKKKIPLKLFRIESTNFGHGKTRNLAISHCRGKIIVFLSQDAIPKDKYWLSSLTNPIKGYIVATFSRQIPRKDSNDIEKFFYKNYFNNVEIIRPNKKLKNEIDKIFFSNVSSAILKNILKKYPFDEKIIMSEDQKFSKTIINAGYKTKYCADSKVIHSHNYSLKQLFKRYFDSALSLTNIYEKSLVKISYMGYRYIIKEFLFILSRKPHKFPYLIIYNMTKFLAVFLGTYSRYIPKRLKRRLSMHAYYFK